MIDKDKLLKLLNERYYFNKEDLEIFHRHIPEHIKDKEDFPQACWIMIQQISAVETMLERLIFMTQEMGNFGSFYPLECLEKMKTMKVILQCEITGIPKDSC